MRTVRLAGALLAALIIADYTVVTLLQGNMATALLPALLGAVAMMATSLRDAASGWRRRLVFASTIFLSLCLCVTLGVAIRDHLTGQMAMLTVLLVAACGLTYCAFGALRRRRRSARFAGYHSGYEFDGTIDR